MRDKAASTETGSSPPCASIPTYPVMGLYDRYFNEPPQRLGTMAAHVWQTDPRRLGIMLARYKFVAKMMSGKYAVAEIGCGDGWAGRIVEQEVGLLHRYDLDDKLAKESGAWLHDIATEPLPGRYGGLYALDVLEHIAKPDIAVRHMSGSLLSDGALIIGMPSLESQAYASEDSRAGHVSCMTEDDLRTLCQRHFRQVFMFGQNDEVVHTGFGPMCHYRLALCVSPKGSDHGKD